MKLIDVRSALKRNRIVFSTYKKFTDNDYRSNLIDYLIKKDGKTRKTIKEEISLIKDYWKCDTMYYYRYRLYEKELTTEELLDYVPPYYFYNFYMPTMYDESRRNIADSKMRMHEFFVSKNIDTPPLAATIRYGKIYDSGGERISYKGLMAILRKSGCPKFFLKPDTGRGGKGIYRLEKIRSEIFINDDLIDEDYFASLTKNKDFVIQESISQRKDLKAIYPASVNTLRVITQFREKKGRICAIILRMGRNGSFVDNSSIGGIFTSVDTSTGNISKTGHLLHSNMKHEKHPDTGFSFDGFTLHEWGNIKQGIISIAEKAPEFPDIAWDIAITNDGIKVIEFNLNYGLDQLQCCIGGMRRRLNINPYIAMGYKQYYLNL